MTFFGTPDTARPAQALPEASPAPAVSRLPGWGAATAIIAALAIMVLVGLLRGDWMPPPLKMPNPGPPFELSVHVSARLIVLLMWVSAVLATGGVIGALVAVRRGLPVPMRTLLIIAGIAAVVMVVLPPFGSTDALDYAVYGHVVALGHSPYVLTPYRYRLMTHANGVPIDWQHAPSVYGPLATAEQYLAARLGGASLARTAFYLKLACGIGFGVIAYLADRILRADAAARARAHLLWTVNPLVLWSAIAGAHIDLIAAVFGVAAVLIIDRPVTSRPYLNAALAGLCVGAAGDIKATFGLFALAVAWGLRRAPGQLLTAAAAAAVVLVPSYFWAGTPAINALTARASAGQGWGFWKFFLFHLGIPVHVAIPAATALLVPVGLLALARLPSGFGNRPAVRAALALSLTWLLIWPHQYAWYSLMAIAVLIFFPASRLDWLAVAWLGVLTYANMPGVGIGQNAVLGHAILITQSNNLDRVAPPVMLATLVLLVVWSFTRRWDTPAQQPG